VNDRPRHYAEKIGVKARETIREGLKDVPEGMKTQVTDMVINGLSIEWNLKKSKRSEK
jgi:hypothetical protein